MEHQSQSAESAVRCSYCPSLSTQHCIDASSKQTNSSNVGSTAGEEGHGGRAEAELFISLLVQSILQEISPSSWQRLIFPCLPVSLSCLPRQTVLGRLWALKLMSPDREPLQRDPLKNAASETRLNKYHINTHMQIFVSHRCLQAGLAASELLSSRWMG